MKRLFLILVCLLFMATTAFAGTTVSLIWSPNSESDLAGYKIYQDGVLQTPDITCPADDASCCEWISQELTEGEHSWYATAFDIYGNESEPSNTVTATIDYTAPVPPNISITINLNVNIAP